MKANSRFAFSSRIRQLAVATLVSLGMVRTAAAIPPPEPYEVRKPQPGEVSGLMAKQQWAKVNSSEPLPDDFQAVDTFLEELSLREDVTKVLTLPFVRKVLALILTYQPPEGRRELFIREKLKSLVGSDVNPGRIPQLLTDIWVLLPHSGIGWMLASMVIPPKNAPNTLHSIMARRLSALSVAAEYFEQDRLKKLLPKVAGTYVDMLVRSGDKDKDKDKIVSVFFSRKETNDTERQLLERSIKSRLECAKQENHGMAVVFTGELHQSLVDMIPNGVQVHHKPYGKSRVLVRH